MTRYVTVPPLRSRAHEATKDRWFRWVANRAAPGFVTWTRPRLVETEYSSNVVRRHGRLLSRLLLTAYSAPRGLLEAAVDGDASVEVAG
jgi:hypothetical protein